MLFCQNLWKQCQIWVSEPHFGEVRGDALPWLIARWKAHGQLSITLMKFLHYLLQFQSYEAKCVQLGCFGRGSTSLHSNFTWTRSSQSTILGIRKLETVGYLMMMTASLCVPSFWHNNGVSKTDGRICHSIYSACKASLTAHCKNCWKHLKCGHGRGCWKSVGQRW